MALHVLARVVCCSLLVASAMTTSAQADSQEGGSPMTVSEGKSISMEYTLTLENKEVLDSNVGGEPLTFTQGSHQIIPGLETALDGMKAGERKQVTVAPEEGYGKVDPQAIQEVPIDQIPPDARKVGVQLQGKDGQGRVVHPTVTEVKDQVVVLDFNHPLAGKTLYFDVKILDVKAATAP
ncbi:FKBP-type peptidyl-prolyl cis-trans isomerase [Candidatus Nitrospira allomarina]|jgi:FKBP-type peptidyl-prolyl cis-trans isomerase SlyD|uniref:Peptidyl-prolyl cis-trans isomerase n=1 Tax=Candidatus Nitrospira allomarina TaxID=3020900 RepID=A0AA96JYE4_9BACT|nr:peptidylprolyl isomerase [Candidatus Nitrospira allomarina]WNM57449.1 peptidylprolyl isomerase [Candidatus Nitrospira allomarina]